MKQQDYIIFQEKPRKEKEELDSKSLKISIARLIIGLLVIGFLLVGNFGHNSLFYGLSLLCVGLFIVLIIIHGRIID